MTSLRMRKPKKHRRESSYTVEDWPPVKIMPMSSRPSCESLSSLQVEDHLSMWELNLKTGNVEMVGDDEKEGPSSDETPRCRSSCWCCQRWQDWSSRIRENGGDAISVRLPLALRASLGSVTFFSLLIFTEPKYLGAIWIGNIFMHSAMKDNFGSALKSVIGFATSILLTTALSWPFFMLLVHYQEQQLDQILLPILTFFLSLLIMSCPWLTSPNLMILVMYVALATPVRFETYWWEPIGYMGSYLIGLAVALLVHCIPPTRPNTATAQMHRELQGLGKDGFLLFLQVRYFTFSAGRSPHVARAAGAAIDLLVDRISKAIKKTQTLLPAATTELKWTGRHGAAQRLEDWVGHLQKASSDFKMLRRALNQRVMGETSINNPSTLTEPSSFVDERYIRCVIANEVGAEYHHFINALIHVFVVCNQMADPVNSTASEDVDNTALDTSTLSELTRQCRESFFRACVQITEQVQAEQHLTKQQTRNTSFVFAHLARRSMSFHSLFALAAGFIDFAAKEVTKAPGMLSSDMTASSTDDNNGNEEHDSGKGAEPCPTKVKSLAVGFIQLAEEGLPQQQSCAIHDHPVASYDTVEEGIKTPEEKPMHDSAAVTKAVDQESPPPQRNSGRRCTCCSTCKSFASGLWKYIVDGWWKPQWLWHKTEGRRHALKMALGMFIASLWMSVPYLWSIADPFGHWPGLTVASVSLATTGSSFHKAIDRLVGTLFAAAYALLVADFFPGNQDVVKIPAIGVFTFCVFYMKSGDHEYQYTYAATSIGSMLYGSVKNDYHIQGYIPQRIQLIFVGVIIFACVELFVFPQTSRVIVETKALEFFDQMQLFLAEARNLMTTIENTEEANYQDPTMTIKQMEAHGDKDTAAGVGQDNVEVAFENLKTIHKASKSASDKLKKDLAFALQEPYFGFSQPLHPQSLNGLVTDICEAEIQAFLLLGALETLWSNCKKEGSTEITRRMGWLEAYSGFLGNASHQMESCCSNLTEAYPDGRLRPQHGNIFEANMAAASFRDFFDVRVRIISSWSENYQQRFLRQAGSGIDHNEVILLGITTSYLLDLCRHIQHAGSKMEWYTQKFPRP